MILDFGLNPQPFDVPSGPIPVAQGIITNFYAAKRMLLALQTTTQRHEGVFGVLETDVQKRVQPDRTRYPTMYLHQQQVFEAVKAGQHVLVSTGTGSGKTESFLYPIIDDLLR